MKQFFGKDQITWKLLLLMIGVALVAVDLFSVGELQGFSYYIVKTPELIDYKILNSTIIIAVVVYPFFSKSHGFHHYLYLTLSVFLLVFFGSRLYLLFYKFIHPVLAEFEEKKSLFFFVEVQLSIYLLIISYLFFSLFLTHLSRREVILIVITVLISVIAASTSIIGYGGVLS